METLALMALLAFPVSADELQIDLTGQEADGTQVTGQMDINTMTAGMTPFLLLRKATISRR